MVDEQSRAYEIRTADSFDDGEADEAKRHWGGLGVRPFFVNEQPWADFMSSRVLAHDPATVFEFGCNVGRNLATLASRAPTVELSGIDINEEAVAAGRARGLDIHVGDESYLRRLRDDAFDVVFTVSVLDHVPDPGPILVELCRVARRSVLALEPWLGEEGKVTQNTDRRTGEMIPTTPYSYSWDYRRLRDEHVPDWSLDVEPYPMDSNLGRYYELYAFEPGGS